MSISPLFELGKQPIPGTSPVGTELRSEPVFELLEAELAKLSSPVHSASTDWNQVSRLAAELLATKGKDLLVACYLAGGLFETRSIAGLADGLQVIADMLETYWETLYPPLKRIRGRRNAVQWLVERLQQRSSETVWTDLSPQPLALVAQLQKNVLAIEAVLADKDSEAPSVRALLALVKSLPTIDDVTPAAPKTPSSASTATPPTLTDTTPFLAPESTEDAEQALTSVCIRLESIAQWLLGVDLSDSLSYRLNRLAAWTAITMTPPVVAGKTPVSGPISQLVDALDTLKASQSDEDLIRFSETQLAAFPFWLDLHCQCALALERQGSSFYAAAREVCGETSRLVTRLPGVEKLTFSDGRPFADGETLAWLTQLTAGQGSDSAKPRERDLMAVTVANALTLAASQDLVGAVDCLQQQLANVNAPKDQLFLQIRLCELLLAERPGAALEAFAMSLVDCIDKYQLTEWEPALALDGLQIAYKALTRNDDNRPAADDLLKRIVRIDAAAAVKLVI